MWEFAVPPHKGDEHFDLGIWHPSALPADKQNREGYDILQLRDREEKPICEDEESQLTKSEQLQAFEDEVCAFVDALPEEGLCSRSWTIVFRWNRLFCLIALWPTVAIELAPGITESANRHGLVCYDPQSDVVSFPQMIG